MRGTLEFLLLLVGFELVIWGVLQLVWKYGGQKYIDLQNRFYELSQEIESVRG